MRRQTGFTHGEFALFFAENHASLSVNVVRPEAACINRGPFDNFFVIAPEAAMVGLADALAA
jgi:hypothetical protein